MWVLSSKRKRVHALKNLSGSGSQQGRVNKLHDYTSTVLSTSIPNLLYEKAMRCVLNCKLTSLLGASR